MCQVGAKIESMEEREYHNKVWQEVECFPSVGLFIDPQQWANDDGNYTVQCKYAECDIQRTDMVSGYGCVSVVGRERQ